MSIKYISKCLCTTALAMSLVGCAATQTMISKKDLNVQTKMSETIFLEPVRPDKKIAFVQVKNTSDKPELDINDQVVAAIASKGYTIVKDPDKANYLIQANILKVGNIDLRDAGTELDQGYGAAISEL